MSSFSELPPAYTADDEGDGDKSSLLTPPVAVAYRSDYDASGYAHDYAHNVDVNAPVGGGGGGGGGVDDGDDDDDGNDSDSMDSEEARAQRRFPERASCRDPAFIVLFAAHLVALAAGYAVLLTKHRRTDGAASAHDYVDTWFPAASATNIAFSLGAAVLGVVVGVGALLLSRRHPKTVLVTSMVTALLLMLAYVAYLCYRHLWLAAGIVGFMTLFFALFLGLAARTRLAFAALMLRTVSSVVLTYPATIGVALAIAVVQVPLAYGYLTAIAELFRTDKYALADAARWSVTVAVLFSMFWTSMLLRAISHSTSSGTFATHYFFTHAMPSSPVTHSLMRTCTTSLGSLCLGSLLLAIVRTFRVVARALMSMRGSRGYLAIIGLVFYCLLSCIDDLLRYFNQYVFSQIAIYGYSYWQGARATLRLFKRAGFEAIVNDDFIDTVLLVASVSVGLLAATLGIVTASLWAHESIDALVHSTDLVLPLFWGYVALASCLAVLDVLQSGVSTYFVCFVENPEILRANDSELHAAFFQTYHGVAEREQQQRENNEEF